MLLDGEDYLIGAATVLKNEKGTVIAVGPTAINAALAQNDTIKDVKVESGVVKSLVGVSVASEQAEANKAITAINAIPAEGDADFATKLEAARTAYDKLTNSQKDLVTNYKKLTDAEAKVLAGEALTAAQEAVEALFTDYATDKDILAAGVDQAKINAASAKVEALPADVAPAKDKADLQADIVKAQGLLDTKLVGDVETAITKIATDSGKYTTVEAARTAFDNLTKAQKDKVDADKVTALTTAETAVANAVAAVNGAKDYSDLKAKLTANKAILDIVAEIDAPISDLKIMDLFNKLPFADAKAINAAVK